MERKELRLGAVEVQENRMWTGKRELGDKRLAITGKEVGEMGIEDASGQQARLLGKSGQ